MTVESMPTSAPAANSAPAAPAPTTIPAPVAAPAAPSDAAPVSGEFERMAAAVALLDAEAAPAPVVPPEAPPPVTPPQVEPKTPVPNPPETPETSPEPEGEPPPKVPTLEELRAEVAARRNGRPQQPQEPPKQEPPPQQPAGILLDKFRADPVAALIESGLNPREVLRQLAQSTMQGQGQQKPGQPQPPAQPQQDIDAIVQARVAEALRPWQEQQQAQEVAQRQQQSESQFLEITADPAKYRYLGRLSAEERIAYGHQVADQYHAAGRQATFDLIAQTVEQHLQSLAERLHTTESAGPGAKSESAAGSEITTPAAANPRPSTLTQSLPATPSPQRALTEEERVAAAIRLAEADG